MLIHPPSAGDPPVVGADVGRPDHQVHRVGSDTLLRAEDELFEEVNNFSASSVLVVGSKQLSAPPSPLLGGVMQQPLALNVLNAPGTDFDGPA